MDSSTADQPSDHLAVQRDRLAGQDPDRVPRPGPPRGERSGPPPRPLRGSPVATGVRRAGRKASKEWSARAARARARASIGPPGDQDGDDERRHGAVEPGGEGAAAAEVDVAAAEGDRLHRADGEGGQRPERDERVHARRPVAEQAGARAHEGPATDDLHGDGQRQHDPAAGSWSRARARRRTAQRGPGARRRWPATSSPRGRRAARASIVCSGTGSAE